MILAVMAFAFLMLNVFKGQSFLCGGASLFAGAFLCAAKIFLGQLKTNLFQRHNGGFCKAH